MQNAAFFLKYRLHHLFIWMLIFGLWFFLREDDYQGQGEAFLVTSVKVADLALMVYVTNYVLIPFLLYKKKYGWFIFSFISLVVGSSVLKMTILGSFVDSPALQNWSADLKKTFYDNVVPHFFLVLAGAAIKLMLDYGQLQQRMAETAKEKAEAELKFLKSQINPHFVFNSLNAVYFLINKDNPAAREALHRFSEMLRYQLYEMGGGRVPIEKEVRYLQDYVELQQLRQNGNNSIDFTCNSSVRDFVIEPLLLIPLVENAFKHLSHYTDKQNFIKMQLDRNNGHFEFRISNSREAVNSTEGQGGIGLANVKRRLELLYPGKHTFSINSSAEEFTVHLNVQLS
jgi:two-component system LytT family sensor kinase